jgi:hypothetical protein
MTDELRDRLARLDPMRSGVPIESLTTESSRQLLEDIMSTPVKEATASDQGGNRSKWVVGVAAAAALVVAVGAGLILSNGGDGGDVVAVSPPMTLSAGEGDGMQMCIQFSTEQLATMPVAFEGTVTALEGEEATLDVDHWYKGGDSEQVVVSAPQGMMALIGGIDLEVGDQYLITASDGTVSYCGFSGPSTPELKAAFEEAFGA